MEQRNFVNKFADYSSSPAADEAVVTADGKVSDGFIQKLHSEIARHLAKLEEALTTEVDSSDYSVYTGTTGIALLYYHLSEVPDKKQKDWYLQACKDLISRPLRHLKGRRVTFLCGDAGPLALGAVVYDRLGKSDKSRECIDRLQILHESVVGDESLPDELLYGRAGYLYALLFVQKHLGEASVNKEIIQKVYRTIIASGERLAQQDRDRGSACPLMYEWHEKKYFGAAHGITGILHTLMQVNDTKYKLYLEDQIRRTVDHLMTLRFPSGNFPSSLGNTTDRLVHWCHGAPGWIHMFILAYKVLGDARYLATAKECAEVLWNRGILKKGYGICHGVAGNAYGFLSMYNLTGDVKYLYRACKFAEWCFDYGKHGCREADRPWSLFEGLAGTIYFWSDLINPSTAQFPAFVLH